MTLGTTLVSTLEVLRSSTGQVLIEYGRHASEYEPLFGTQK